MSSQSAEIPAKLIRRRKLHTLSARQLQFDYSGRFCLAKYDVAVWLRLSKPAEGKVALILSFVDDVNERLVVVDEIDGDAESIMLSGRAVFRGIGRLREASARVAGIADDTEILVDEVHVRPVDEAVVEMREVRRRA